MIVYSVSVSRSGSGKLCLRGWRASRQAAVRQGHESNEVIELTVKLWQTFSDQASEILNRPGLLRGLPVDLAKPEARDEVLKELNKRESRRSITAGK